MYKSPCTFVYSKTSKKNLKEKILHLKKGIGAGLNAIFKSHVAISTVKENQIEPREKFEPKNFNVFFQYSINVLLWKQREFF